MLKLKHILFASKSFEWRVLRPTLLRVNDLITPILLLSRVVNDSIYVLTKNYRGT